MCGEWYLHLGVHTNAAHGLNADTHRKAFGLMRKTKAERIRSVHSPRRERVKTMTTEERRAEQANREWRAVRMADPMRTNEFASGDAAVRDVPHCRAVASAS